jgi:dTDP-4-amino-4,6-dideoxygalactose transaminase
MEAYAHLGYRQGDFPVAEGLSRECLSLPMFPGITEAQLAAVVEAVRSFFDG